MPERMIRNALAFLQSSLGKATLGLFTGVVCFCWPAAVAYPAGALCLYYTIHQLRPVGAWIYHDIREDLNGDQAADGTA